jgi:hypothetical protein
MSYVSVVAPGPEARPSRPREQGCLPEFFGHSGGYRVRLFTAKIIQVGNW